MARIGVVIGHGGTDPGAVSQCRRFVEKDIALQMGLRTRERLQAMGHSVIINRTTDVASREAAFATELRGQVDCAVALHLNAFNRSAHGFEAFRNINDQATRAAALADTIRQHVIRGKSGLRDRGTKRGEGAFAFAMLRQNYPCAYLEACFLDSPTDQRFIDTAAEIRRFGDLYAEGIDAWCRANGLGATPQQPSTPTPTPPPSSGNSNATSNTMHRVQAGAFTNAANANTRLAKVRRTFPGAFIATEGNIRRVIIGSFRERANAERAAQQGRQAGFDTAIVTVNLSNAPSAATPSTPAITVGSVVTIRPRAAWGGLTNVRGRVVDARQLAPKQHTVSAIQVNRNVREALLRDIRSWVAISSLTRVR